jgi:hypothetical protein
LREQKYTIFLDSVGILKIFIIERAIRAERAIRPKRR